MKGVDLDPDINFEQLAELTDQYSGRDIALICRESIMKPIREMDMSGKLIETANPRSVNQQDFLESIENIKSSVSTGELKKFEDWENEFGSI